LVFAAQAAGQRWAETKVFLPPIETVAVTGSRVVRGRRNCDILSYLSASVPLAVKIAVDLPSLAAVSTPH
jgi:hypothetical protein